MNIHESNHSLEGVKGKKHVFCRQMYLHDLPPEFPGPRCTPDKQFFSCNVLMCSLLPFIYLQIRDPRSVRLPTGIRDARKELLPPKGLRA